VLHVGELVAGILDLDVGGADAGNPRPADFAVAQRVQQNREPREVMRVLRFDADQRHLILEFAEVLAGRNDRRVDSQHVKPQSVVAAVVADLDDVALANLLEGVGKLVVLFPLLFTNRVEKRVPDFRRDVERLAGLGLLVAIPHRYVPMPRPEKSPYS